MKKKNSKTPYIIATVIVGIIGIFDFAVPNNTESSRSTDSEQSYSEQYLSVENSSVGEIIDRSVVSDDLEIVSYEETEEESYSQSIVESDPNLIPLYSGADSVILNDNKPMFNQYDVRNIKVQWFTPLDSLGRCGSAIAMIDRSMMPTEERGYIGDVKPSGWHTVKYPDLISDMYLYNRCHLIGYALTGENANELNLITGTRYFNVSIMYEFERKVIDTIENTDNHVLYRVTPYFMGDELVARGVEIEAFSVEDYGQSVCFHVFCYNVQPGIGIDYLTGESWVE
ncbi:MAG: DNA/RNA non-specific endonuclease [Lachnospiraceae bacterium]|nr:DNA/RNA non-specific endonuclease [Lachnospiraceae bacterium]